MAVTVKITSGDITPFSLVNIYGRFGGTYYLHPLCERISRLPFRSEEMCLGIVNETGNREMYSDSGKRIE
jgi:hypothetical protein